MPICLLQGRLCAHQQQVNARRMLSLCHMWHFAEEHGLLQHQRKTGIIPVLDSLTVFNSFFIPKYCDIHARQVKAVLGASATIAAATAPVVEGNYTQVSLFTVTLKCFYLPLSHFLVSFTRNGHTPSNGLPVSPSNAEFKPSFISPPPAAALPTAAPVGTLSPYQVSLH